MMTDPNCIWCMRLDGDGGGQEIPSQEVRTLTADDGVYWMHLDRMDPGSQTWLRESSGLDPMVVDALLEEETRPRIFLTPHGLVVILRGVNLNPGSDPEDMVSLRLWIGASRIVTLRHRRLMAVQDIRDSLVSHAGPKDSAGFLVMVAERLIERMSPVVNELDDATDELEDRMIEDVSAHLREKSGQLRRQVISLRRHLAPQREVMAGLQAKQESWGGKPYESHLRETSNHLIRYIEDLDAIRERVAVMQEELASKLAERMTQTMYALTILAGVFLPLTFLTGLLGINVAGIPGSENPWAFVSVCVILAGITGAQIWVFRRLKWI